VLLRRPRRGWRVVRARLARWRNGGGADVAEEKVEAAAAAFGRVHGAGHGALRFDRSEFQAAPSRTRHCASASEV